MRRLVDWFLGLPAQTLFVAQVFALILWHLPRMGDLSPYVIFAPGVVAAVRYLYDLWLYRGHPPVDRSGFLRFLNLFAPRSEPKIEPPLRDIPKNANPNAAYFSEPDPVPMKPLYEPMVVGVGRRPEGWTRGSVTQFIPDQRSR